MEKVRNIKTLLAKLMATENISVRHQAVQTASFDVLNRVLTLPVYNDDLTNDELDLFVGHEVGHALFTPSTDLDTIINGRKYFKDFLNIVEDARIEKLIQRRFPGLRKNFVGGYNGLVERGFFGKDKDINNYNFIDRINIYFKTRNESIEFSDEEQVFVDAIKNLEDWDSTLDLTEKLFEYCGKKGQEEKETLEEMKPQSASDNGQDNQDADGEESPSESSDGSEEENNKDQQSADDGEETEQDGEDQPVADVDDDGIDDSEGADNQGGLENNEELESQTSIQFEKGMQEIVNNNVAEVFEAPLYKVQKQITPIEKIWELVNESIHFESMGYHQIFKNAFKVDSLHDIENKLGDLHGEFVRSQKSVINYMVKEFEMKKKADEYKRTREAKTGTLNMSKLYNYKYSEDLFLKNNITKDGKSHGMVMLVDWSGSMYGQMMETLQQIQILITFCQKVNIPFDVYAFTDSMYDRGTSSAYSEKVYEENQWDLGHGFSLMHLASSTFNRTQKDISNKALSFFKEVFNSEGNHSGYILMSKIHKSIQLGQTPIASSLLSMFPILQDFQSRTHVDILNLVCLTDGEGQCRVNFDQGNQRGTLSWGYSSKGHFILKGNKADYTLKSYNDDDDDTPRHMRRPNGGYAIHDVNKVETNLYDILRQEFDNLRITGFYLAPGGRNAMVGIYNEYVVSSDHCIFAASDELKKINKTYNQKKFIKPNVDTFQYDNLFIVKGSSLQIDDEWEVDEQTVKSTAKLRKSFSKMMTNKVTDRVLASNFIEVIA